MKNQLKLWFRMERENIAVTTAVSEAGTHAK